MSPDPSHDGDEYHHVAAQMLNLAQQQPSFLGVETVRDANGFGITNSFWSDETSIRLWKANIDHQFA